MTNSNPLIESETQDTLLNVRTVCQFIESFHEEQQFSSNTEELSVNHPVAIKLIMKCANSALTHEINRLEVKDVNKGAPP